MSTTPLVTIILPVFNDEEWIEAALESCVSQTLSAIEILCVDDASTDSTCAIVERFAATDPRVRLIRQPENRSAFQARRVGVFAARAPHILFLDGDDELAPEAAEKTLAAATAHRADLVGIGVAVLGPENQTIGGYQARLKPTHDRLEGAAVFAGLFPAGKPVQGQLWRYLFAASLLRGAYELLPEDLVLPRVNDLPITFLAVARATRYVSVPDRLYRYFFRRGGSGHRVDELSQLAFYAGGITSVDSIGPAVRQIARGLVDPEPLLASYDSARRSLIGNVIGYLLNSVSEDLYDSGLGLLEEHVPAADLVLAAAEYRPEALTAMARHGAPLALGARPVRSVLLSTKKITTGGVSLVLLAQAREFLEAGYRVTIVAHRGGSTISGIPEGATFLELTGPLSQRLARWAEICREQDIDVIVDHQVLYGRVWPAYALMARASGVPTIGWVHSYSLRPIYDENEMLSFIRAHVGALTMLVTLSPRDVAFWKLQGVDRVTWLPNPPSPMLTDAVEHIVGPKAAPTGRIELIWWGRLEQHTKRVLELVEICAHLRDLGTDFRLTVIGPDSPQLTSSTLLHEFRRRGLEERVRAIGARHGSELLAEIDRADVFVTTSIIEGYQLTLAEAQSRGLPVVMYELPWLTLVEGNEGVLAVPHGDADAFARRVAEIAADPARYAELSEASLDAARRATSFDFAALYTQLVTDDLPTANSPEPTIDDARQLLSEMIFYSERGVAERRGSTAGGAPGTKKRPPQKATPPDSATMRRLRPVLRRVYRAAPALRPLGVRFKKLLAGPAAWVRRVEKKASR